jgi:tetratricopeptide (TPR) repeat protein
LATTLTCVGLGLCVTTNAEAEPPVTLTDAEKKTLALQKFEAGEKAFAEKRYKDAIELFLRADAIIENPAFAYNASLAYEAMGDDSAALAWAREYLYRAPSAEDRESTAARVVLFEKKLAAKGVQQVTVRTTPRGATVLVDGAAVGVTPWTGDLAPGRHVIELGLRGHQDRTTELQLPADKAQLVELQLEVAASEPALAPPPQEGPALRPTPEPAKAPVPASRPGWLLPTSLAVLGLGLGAAGAAIGLEFARAGAEEDARLALIQVEAADHLQRRQDFQTGARVAVGFAAGFALLGATGLVVDLTAFNAESEAVQVQGRCVGDGCALLIGGAF